MPFPPWAGFERRVRGRLLEQVVDLRGALGVAYERSVGYEKSTHVHDRSMLVCARGSAAMNIVAGGARHRADASHLVWVPRDVPHADEAVTTLYDTVALYPSEALLQRAAREVDLGARDVTRLERRVLHVRRQRFFDELLDRWFFARLVQRARIDPFQELQLVNEALRVLFAKPPSTIAPTASSVAERALQHIEANLFLPLPLDELAAHAGASVSSLLRHFRAAFGRTPHAYIKARRLDEARHLLASGRHRVSEVALLVGYDDLGAFGKAFRARFGTTPSQAKR